MIKNILFTIGGMTIGGLLFIIYLFQNREKNKKTSIYLLLLIINLVIGLFDIVSLILLDNKLIIAGAILTKIKFASYITYYLLLYLYTLIYINKKADITLKELLFHIAFLPLEIIILLSAVAVIIVPLELFDEFGNFIYFSGIVSYIIIGVLIFVLFMLEIKSLSKHKDFNNNDKKYLFFIILFNVIILIIQVLYPSIAILQLGNVALLYLMYNVQENPDISTIDSIEDTSKNAKKHKSAKLGFVSNLSTDIKNSMNNINNTIGEILNAENMDDEQLKANVKSINTSSHEILNSINNLLAASNIENGSEGLVNKQYNIRELIDECTNGYAQTIKDKGLDFEVNIGNNIPTNLIGDANKLKQVINNILENSIDNTHKGKIVLTVTGETIEKVVNIDIKIADTGIGMNENVKSRIFTKIESKEKNQIGLFIAKKYIDLMEGRIWFESKEMLGTTFYIELAQVIGNEPSASLQSYADFTGTRVLIVDDNKLNLTVAKKMLEFYNIDVTTVSTGEECVNTVNGSSNFDLILLDQSMPGMDGVETFKKIKTLNARVKIPPIIAFTANAIDGMKENYEAEGFDDYLSKPIVKADLDRILTTYIKKK